MSEPFSIELVGETDPGLVRELNEDRWGCSSDKRFVVVADGMGGHRGGDVAAEEAVDSLCDWYDQQEPDLLKSESEEHLTQRMVEAVRAANKAVFEKGCSRSALRGMGSTMCCLLFVGGRVVRCHAGDSRIYRFRDRKLVRLTRDDSLVSDLIDLGQMEEEDVPDYAYRNVVTRALGMEWELTPHVKISDLNDGDVYLVCSDGLTSMLNDSEIEKVLQSLEGDGAFAPTVVEELMTATHERGAKDNITVVVTVVTRNSV